MKRLLMNCYYDGMSLEDTIKFIKKGYWETPTEKQIAKAKKLIKETTGKEWK